MVTKIADTEKCKAHGLDGFTRIHSLSFKGGNGLYPVSFYEPEAVTKVFLTVIFSDTYLSLNSNMQLSRTNV